jgi:serine/threonine protein kinase
MEFIDGENLASLMRRISRLPVDKACQIAHEICAGMAAIHERGVLHRDLKPANIMLDGRGHARITDFGLAIVQGRESEPDAIAGTPAYMAPESFLGGARPAPGPTSTAWGWSSTSCSPAARRSNRRRSRPSSKRGTKASS